MQVGISTASLFNRYDLEDAPAHMKTMGASICEIFLNTFSEYEDGFVQALKKRVDESGLQVYSVHPMGTQFEPQLFSIHRRQREDAKKIFEQVLRAGKTLNATCYVMHGPSGLNGAVRNMDLARIGPIVQELCGLAAAYSLTLAWENVSWCLFHTPSYGLMLLEATKADDLRFTLDIKQAARSGYAPEDYIEAVGEYLVNLHVCDYKRTSERIVPVLPGEGECNLFTLGQALKAKGYSGPAFVEVYSDMYADEAELKRCYDYVKACFTPFE
ncbi:MAG TPA: sugar phosphate isomerase/epimerase [Feifaniaceae bacterium]|nr:sugar phosphate isomerase/epimerase [Feifaniaceae bacterium]